MTEYQYYEFQAMDRPLTNFQMEELRDLSTRAQITSTKFINTYSWGDFKGNPRVLMEKYFDAFVYIANWGTNWFMFRLPRRIMDPDELIRYCAGGCASAWVAGEQVILDFRSEHEQGEWVDGEGWLSSLVYVRAELARGDRRCLYLGWLLSAQEGELNDDDIEPPVPDNLQRLSGALESFAEFLRIDSDLIEAAASGNHEQASSTRSELEQWISQLTADEKDSYLYRLINGSDPHLGAEFKQRFEREARCEGDRAHDRRRTVGALLQAGKERAELRRVEARQHREQEAVRRELARIEARKRHLESLCGKSDSLWGDIDQLIGTKQTRRYQEAISLLEDLRDLAEMEHQSTEFLTRINAFCSEHARKPALIWRIDQAWLRS